MKSGCWGIPAAVGFQYHPKGRATAKITNMLLSSLPASVHETVCVPDAEDPVAVCVHPPQAGDDFAFCSQVSRWRNLTHHDFISHSFSSMSACRCLRDFPQRIKSPNHSFRSIVAYETTAETAIQALADSWGSLTEHLGNCNGDVEPDLRRQIQTVPSQPATSKP